MVMCWAADCKHYNVRDNCRYFRFPKSGEERWRWKRLLKRNIEPGASAVVCSCHFPGGNKQNGPEIRLPLTAIPKTKKPEEAKARRPRRTTKKRKLSITSASSFFSDRANTEENTQQSRVIVEDIGISSTSSKKDLLVDDSFDKRGKKCEVCNICLNYTPNIENIAEFTTRTDGTINMSSLAKLSICVPEVEWTDTYHICKVCKRNLDRAYNFRETCIQNARIHHEILISPEQFDPLSVEVKTEDIINDDDIVIKMAAVSEEGETTDDASETARQYDETIPSFTKTLLVDDDDDDDDKNVIIIKKSNIDDDKKEKPITTINVTSNRIELSPAMQESLPQQTCNSCGMKFDRNKQLREQFRANRTLSAAFLCNKCDSGIAYDPTHDYLSHVCEYCGKEFKSHTNLDRHLPIHLNQRDFRCGMCEKAFNTPELLHGHRMNVHLDLSEWKYGCDRCEKVFPTTSRLKSHMRIHDDAKQYECNVCGKAFKYRGNLKTHRFTHSNISDLRCELCGKEYQKRGLLEVHLSTVHGILAADDTTIDISDTDSA